MCTWAVVMLVALAAGMAATSCGGAGLEKAIKQALINGDTTEVAYDSLYLSGLPLMMEHIES